MTGLRLEGFLELLTHYLGSTLVSFEGEMFVQRHRLESGPDLMGHLS